jgi:Fe-S cluster biogenesis protein NfuA/nitrite reductase/ring-hydroxylating ferredoxin subunit
MTARVVALDLTAPASRSAPDGEELIARVQTLSARLESIEDDVARDTAHELLAALLELYGAGLERVMVALAAPGADVDAVRDSLVEDDVVGSLLLIHGLYPVSLDDRVQEALDSVRPYMESHGGDVELVGIEDGVAHLRLRGSCDGCPSSASTMELAVKEALEANAPDLAGIEVEGVIAPTQVAARVNGARLPVVDVAQAPSWVPVPAVESLPIGATRVTDVAGARVLFANVGGTLLAYRDGCAACGTPLHDGALEDGVLTCRACGSGFALTLAGRAVGSGGRALVPLPLLRQEDAVRVAVGG